MKPGKDWKLMASGSACCFLLCNFYSFVFLSNQLYGLLFHVLET